MIPPCSYVAMHSMQETTSSSHSHGSNSLHSRNGSTGSSMLNGYGDGGLLDGYAGGRGKGGQSGTEVAIMVAGMLVPLLTQVGHGHAHGH